MSNSDKIRVFTSNNRHKKRLRLSVFFGKILKTSSKRKIASGIVRRKIFYSRLKLYRICDAARKASCGASLKLWSHQPIERLNGCRSGAAVRQQKQQRAVAA